MVIKGRAGDNDRRKFVGRREGSRADGGTEEPQNYIRTERVSTRPRDPCTSPRALIFPTF